MKKLFRLILVMVLATMTMSFSACDNNEPTPPAQEPTPKPDYECFYRLDGGDKVEIKSVYMEQREECLLILFSPADGALNTESLGAEYVKIELPVAAVGGTMELIECSDVVVYAMLECLDSPIGVNCEGITTVKSGELTVTNNGDNSYAINLGMTLKDGKLFEACCVGECEIEELPVLPDEGNYFAYNGEIITLNSMGYMTNNVANIGLQYAMVMTPVEGLDTYDAMIDSGEYLFLSLGKGLIADAQEIDVMDISADDEMYMFFAVLDGINIEDYAFDHSSIAEGMISVSIDAETCDLTLDASYKTRGGDSLRVLATLPLFAKPEKPEDVGNTFCYNWTNISKELTVGAAFVEDTLDGVVYTLCVDDVKTYVSYEDTVFLRVEVAGRRADDSFKFDVATCDEEFNMWLCDPIRGMDLRVNNERREGCSGEFSVQRGVVVCNLYYDATNADNIEFNTAYGGKYRSVNECYDIVYDERTTLFVPRSVVLDNSGEEFKIYVSSKEGVTTVAAMADAEVVIAYPSDGWETLLKGNFVSGSSHRTMSFTLNGERCVKGEGDILGMNCQFKAYDAANGRIGLNANLYNERGGVALYYSGSFTLVE